MFGLNDENHDIKLIKAYLLPVVDNERDIGSIVVGTANEFVSLKSGDIQLLDSLNVLRGATNLEFLPRAYKTVQTKVFFSHRKSNHRDKWNHTERLFYQSFHNELKNCNFLAKTCRDYEKVINIARSK